MKWGCVILLVLFSVLIHAQNPSEKIDLSRIPQKKIRSLLMNKLTGENNLIAGSIQVTYRKGQDFRGYHLLESDYLVKENPDSVWKTYQSTSPAISWDGRMVSFGLLLSRANSHALYKNDPSYSGIDTSQVFFVNLRIMKGLYNLAVGLKIVEIDPVHRSIRFSYLKGGKSQGEQCIVFLPTSKGYTRITHRTLFKSNSFLRDRYFYPFFHRIAINEFHRNMKRCILPKTPAMASCTPL